MKLLLNASVRYWEDCEINGHEIDETDFDKIPCKKEDSWKPVIDIDSGIIENWTNGISLKTYFKVCDECSFEIRDEMATVYLEENEYVPEFLSLHDRGFGDYIYLEIDKNGLIQDWKKDSVFRYIQNAA